MGLLKKFFSVWLFCVILTAMACICAFAASNVASGRPVVVSSTTSDEFIQWKWHYSYLNDGREEYGWTSNVQTNATENATEWAKVYLENIYTIESVVLKPVPGKQICQEYEVLLSTDGSWFYPVATGSFSGAESATVSLSGQKACAVMIRSDKLAENENDGYMLQIGELEVYGTMYTPTLGARIAPTGVTYSSSYEQPSENWCGDMVCDNNLNTGWTSAQRQYGSGYKYGNTRYCNEWVQMDLGSLYALSYVTMYAVSGTYYAEDFNISVSPDGVNYTVIASRYECKAHNRELLYFDAEGIEARYVRFECSKFGEFPKDYVSNDGYMVQIKELAAYGTAASATTLHTKKPQLSMAPEETEKIAPFYRDGRTDTYTYTSSSPSVATVASDGTITAIAHGYTEITVQGSYGTSKVRVYVEERERNIKIMAFWPPTPEYTNGTQYKLMRDANFDSYEGNDLLQTEAKIKESSFFAYENGLYFSPHLPDINLTTSHFDTIQAAAEVYSDIPGIGGIHLYDEPWDPVPFANAYHAVRRADNSFAVSLNFLPPHAYNDDDNPPYLNAYPVMDNWTKLTDHHYALSFDNYPFPDNSTAVNEDQLLSNMEIVRRAAYNNGKIDTGMYVQSTCKPGGFRDLNEAELRYHINVALAYGYKQIKYFTYFLPTNRSETFTDAIVNEYGVPGERYESVKALNLEVKGLGHVLIDLDAAYVYQAGTYSGSLATALPDDCFIQRNDDNNYIISILKHRQTNRNFLMIVNKNYQSSVTASFTLTGVSSLQKVHATMGRLQDTTEYSGSVLTVDLLPGACALYALPEGFDYMPEEKQTDDNLLRYATVKASNGIFSGGWGAGCLNDGVTQGTDSSAGWENNSTLVDEAWICFDMKEEKTFNCIELFPGYEGGDVAKNYPTDMHVFISEDNEHWEEVYYVEDLEKPTLYAKRYFPGEITTRYIKFWFPKPSAVALGEIALYEDGNREPLQQTTFAVTQGAMSFREAAGNVAWTKPIADYSSAYQDTENAWRPQYATDGSKDDTTKNGWTSQVRTNYNNAPQWITIDLISFYNVEKVVLYPRPEGIGFPTDYYVQISEDGEHFETVATRTGDTSTAFAAREIEFETKKARYVRIYGYNLKNMGNDGYLMQLGEIEVHGELYTEEPKGVYIPSSVLVDYSTATEPAKGNGIDGVADAGSYAQFHGRVEHIIFDLGEASDICFADCAIASDSNQKIHTYIGYYETLEDAISEVQSGEYIHEAVNYINPYPEINYVTFAGDEVVKNKRYARLTIVHNDNLYRVHVYCARFYRRYTAEDELGAYALNVTDDTAVVYGHTCDYSATLYGGALEGEYGRLSVSDTTVLSVTPKETGETPDLAVTAKKVGTSTVTLTREESRFYAPHTVSYTFTVTPRELTPNLTAADKTYDGSVSAEGTLQLENTVAGDDITCSYTECAFASSLVGTRTATATGITISGADVANYTLARTTASDDAAINMASLDVEVISYKMNQTVSNTIKTETINKAADNNISLPSSCILAYSEGSFGTMTNGEYARTGIYHNALGVLWDNLSSEVVVGGVPCVTLQLTVTTGQPFVYGDNTTGYDEETAVVTYASSQDSWQIENKARTIATNAPATANLNVYLRQGEHLLVDTAIGTYNGRMDVTVKKHGEQTILATDKIDTFFPVNYGDDFRVSKLTEATQSQAITSRGDYWNGIESFTAPETGVYTFTFTVTGESYLHSLDARYKQNLPAMKPVIELRKFTINGKEEYGIDKQ